MRNFPPLEHASGRGGAAFSLRLELVDVASAKWAEAIACALRVPFMLADATPRTRLSHWDAVVLLDSHGAAAITRVMQLRESGFPGALVVATQYPSVCASAGLQAGADAWYSACVDGELLVSRIRTLRRRAVADPLHLETSVHLDPKSFEVTLYDQLFCMKPTAFRIFTFLVARRPQWVRQLEILRSVFGTHHNDDSSIVRVHVHEARRSLGKYGSVLESREHFGYRVNLAAAPRRAQSGTREIPHRLLLVEDDEASARAYVRLLQADGYDVVRTSNGREARSLATRGYFAGVIDPGLPDIDGFALAREFIERRLLPHVIIFTGQPCGDLAAPSGVHAVVSKSDGPTALLHALRECHLDPPAVGATSHKTDTREWSPSCAIGKRREHG